MVRQFVAALTVVSALSGFVAFTSEPASATLRCSKPDAKGTVHCWKEGKDGKPIPGSGTIIRRKSLDGKTAYQPSRDTRPGRRLPNPGGQVFAAGVGEQVDSPRDCDSGVATYDDTTKKWTCQSGEVKLISFGNSQGRYCRRVIKTECRRGTIIRSLPPLHISQVPDPAVPAEQQKPSEIYPGLPPAPTVPTGNLTAADFTPPAGSGTYQGGNGSPNQGSGASRFRSHIANLIG